MSSAASAASSSAHKETEVEHELRVKCAELDVAKSGSILVSQLKKVMANAGLDMGESELNEMIAEADAGSTVGEEERVQYEKFINAMYAEEGGEEEQEQ